MNDRLFGKIPDGWTRESWLSELKRRSAECREINQDQAEAYTMWAEILEDADDE